jgi:hypothetical protein
MPRRIRQVLDMPGQKKSIISFLSFRLFSGITFLRSGPPYRFQLFGFMLHVRPVVFSDGCFGDFFHKSKEVVQADD